MIGSFLTFSIAWYNLPFTIMLVIGVIFAGLQLFGLSQEGDTDADVDSDVDLDADVDAGLDADLHADADTDIAMDHDLSHDLDHDIDHDIDHDADHDVSHDSISSFSWLAFIGVGKAPLMVVVLIVLMTTSLLGWFLNGLAVGVLGFFPGLLLLLTFMASVVLGSLISSRVTRFIGRTLPPISTTATRALALVGQPGTVISPFVDDRYGMVHLRDDGGTLITVFATTEDEQPITRGDAVILLSYDVVQRRYLVTHR